MAYKFRRCCDSPAQQSAEHVRGCVNRIPTADDRAEDVRRHNAATIPGWRY